ncbi:uncharacterized protein LOC141619860 isoform X1 [Silene latifolia]|uniref:uncharacterized protein LOC141619860 isoform X1 n=1 Tax=Silene latifolia TaxID=37657 RepID=UPI003D78747C
MKLIQPQQNPSNPFQHPITNGFLTLHNAATQQYLDTARGHYITALSARIPTNQQPLTNICAPSLPPHSTYHQLPEADQPPTPQHHHHPTTVFEMQFPKPLFNASKNQLHFNPTLSTTNTPQLPEMVDTLGVVIGQEMLRLDASQPQQALMSVSSDIGDANDSLPKGMLETSTSLHKTVESLKTELEHLKREHADFKDNDLLLQSALNNCNLKPSRCNPNNEAHLAEEDKSRHAYEEAHQNKNETDSLNIINSKRRKREHCSFNTYSQLDKRPTLTPHITEANGRTMTALDATNSVPHRIYTTCVSTSESSARIMNSEDELESSTQQPEDSNNLPTAELMVIQPRIEAHNCDRLPKFSIRDYVFSARNKDISTNWPFSEKNLQLCLKHGVKNVLPPFQPVDSFRDNSVKRCLVEKSISSEESNLNERPSVMKIHLVRDTAINRCWNQEFAEGFRDLDSFPSVREKDLAFQTTPVLCQSEVGSVSTSNLPLSEVVSDENEAAGSAANKTKSSVSQVFDKKRRTALKLPVNSRRATPEDITSACTAPSEATATKICPVCENFSSSSNTTLNAHIDQCLSSQSSPNWMNNSKLVNPRIKPRKMRSMVDICATAPQCTLEDLDRRNGSNWAINLDTTSEDTGLRIEGSNHRVSSRYTVNNFDDDSVYIDSSGRKIRILSKFNETVPSSFPKPRKDPKVRKQCRRGKRSNLFSASRKRRLVKHLKYLRVTRQKKHLLSLKVKEYSAKACAAEKATCAGHESHMKQQPTGSLGNGLEAQEQRNQIVPDSSGGCTSSFAKKNDPEATTTVCRYDLRMRSDHKVTGRKFAKKLPHFPKKPLCSIQQSMRAEHRSSGSSCGKTMRSPLKNKIQDNKQTILVPLKFRDPGFNGESTKDCVWKSLESGSTPVRSLEREIEIQSDAVLTAGSCKILHSCRTNSFDEMRSCNSETDARSNDTGDQSGAVQGCSQSGLRDTNRFSECGGGAQCNYGFAGSAETGHGEKDIDDPDLSTSLAFEETDISLNPSFDPELSTLLSSTMQCTNKFQSPLSQDGSKGYLPQHDLVEEQMLYRDVSATERSELKMGNGNFNLMEIDPILIPGPPGSDLPSFSDMGSEDLQTSSSALEHSFGDGDNVVNGDSSDSLFSAASSIFNLGVTNDHVYQGWFGASSPLDTLTVFSKSTAVKTERVASIVNDLKEGQGRSQQCCCSRKEAIPWSAAMNIQESELLVQKMSSLVAFPGEKYTYSSLTKWPYGQDDTICRSIESEKVVDSGHTSHQNITSVQSLRIGDSDSSTPAPILRLMGKDLMVVNNEEDDPSLVPAAQNVNPNSETSSKHDVTWEHHSSQSPALIGPLPYVQDPCTFSVKCFDVGPSNMINSSGSPNSTSGDTYINNPVHPRLGIHGTAPLKR